MVYLILIIAILNNDQICNIFVTALMLLVVLLDWLGTHGTNIGCGIGIQSPTTTLDLMLQHLQGMGGMDW